jgi:hypothetical protein
MRQLRFAVCSIVPRPGFVFSVFCFLFPASRCAVPNSPHPPLRSRPLPRVERYLRFPIPDSRFPIPDPRSPIPIPDPDPDPGILVPSHIYVSPYRQKSVAPPHSLIREACLIRDARFATSPWPQPALAERTHSNDDLSRITCSAEPASSRLTIRSG